MEKTYDIAQAARFLGVPASTLRYWEDERLIRSQRDERNGYRRYALHDLMEAGEVAFCREMGVSVGSLRGCRDFTAAQFDELLHAARISIDERLEELERMRRRVGFQLEMNERARLLSDGCLRPGFRRWRVSSRSTTTRSVNGACSWGMRANTRFSSTRGGPESLSKRSRRTLRARRRTAGNTVRAMATSLCPTVRRVPRTLAPCFGASRTRLRAPSGSRAFSNAASSGTRATPSICSTRRVRWGCIRLDSSVDTF